MDHSFAAERSGKVEEHDIESLPFFVHITPQVFHRLFRVAFDDRIGRFPDSLVLPVQVHLQVVIFHDTLHVPLTHQDDAVLWGVTVHNRYTQAFTIMQDTGQQYRKDGFSHATLLAGDGNQQLFFFFHHTSFPLNVKHYCFRNKRQCSHMGSPLMGTGLYDRPGRDSFRIISAVSLYSSRCRETR